MHLGPRVWARGASQSAKSGSCVPAAVRTAKFKLIRNSSAKVGVQKALEGCSKRLNRRTQLKSRHKSIRYNPAMESIVVDPDICNGRPTVRGTRITVYTVLEFLGAGDTVDDLLTEYPALTREDVQASLRYTEL